MSRATLIAIITLCFTAGNVMAENAPFRIQQIGLGWQHQMAQSASVSLSKEYVIVGAAAQREGDLIKGVMYQSDHKLDATIGDDAQVKRTAQNSVSKAMANAVLRKVNEASITIKGTGAAAVTVARDIAPRPGNTVAPNPAPSVDSLTIEKDVPMANTSGLVQATTVTRHPSAIREHRPVLMKFSRTLSPPPPAPVPANG